MANDAINAKPGLHKWQGSEDDQTRVCGDYILRVEQMNAKTWWWKVYHKDGCVNEGYRNTIQRAKIRCMDVMAQHKELVNS